MTMLHYNENAAILEAIEAAKLSKCQSQRGVALWDYKLGLLSTGYNRPPHPFVCTGTDECRANCAKTATHAEQVAIINFLKQRSGVSLHEAEMIHVKVVNGEPVHSLQPSCWQCSKLILDSGIKYMWLYQKEGFVRYTALDFHNETLKNNGLAGTIHI